MSDQPEMSVEELARQVGRYSADAYYFLQEGLTYTVHHVHGDPSQLPYEQRHITGPQLCEGMRQLAIQKWGGLAEMVLARWNITETMDFGRMVFAMVDHKLMQKRPEDRIEDFLDVYNFSEALNTSDSTSQ